MLLTCSIGFLYWYVNDWWDINEIIELIYRQNNIEQNYISNLESLKVTNKIIKKKGILLNTKKWPVINYKLSTTMRKLIFFYKLFVMAANNWKKKRVENKFFSMLVWQIK